MTAMKLGSYMSIEKGMPPLYNTTARLNNQIKALCNRKLPALIQFS